MFQETFYIQRTWIVCKIYNVGKLPPRLQACRLQLSKKKESLTRYPPGLSIANKLIEPPLTIDELAGTGIYITKYPPNLELPLSLCKAGRGPTATPTGGRS